VARTAGIRWLLVADDVGRPLGWLDIAAHDPDDTSANVTTEDLAPFGHAFQPGRDSLRAALDAAVLFPAVAAAAVDEAGRLLGLVSYQAIMGAIQESGGNGTAPATVQVPTAGAG
jgi:osmoprotectant transport system ATP-binding protein